MKKTSPIFNLGLLTMAAGALALSGCGQQQPQYLAQNQNAKICTDKSGKRVSERKCERRGGHGGGGFFWMFMNGGQRVPGYGGYASGSFRPSAGRSYSSGRAFSGRAVTSASSRGGFGSSARGFGGGSSFSSGG